MTEEQISEQREAAFELANALDAAGRLIRELDDCRSMMEDLTSKLSAIVGEAQGQWDALKVLCDGRPTNRDELLVWLKARPWVKHSTFRDTPTDEVLKFDRYQDRRFYFGDVPSAYTPTKSQRSFGAQSIEFRYEGFTLYHYGDRFYFNYLMNVEASNDQAS